MLTPLDTNFLDGISVGAFLIVLAIPAILWVVTLVSIITSRNWTPGMKALWALAALPSGLIGMICWFVWGRPEGNKLAIEYYGGQLPSAVAPYGHQVPGTYATQPQQPQNPVADSQQPQAPDAPQAPADAAPYATGAFGDGQAAPGASKYATTQGQRFEPGTAFGSTRGYAPGQDVTGSDSAGQGGSAPQAGAAPDDGDTRPDIPQVPDNGQGPSGRTAE